MALVKWYDDEEQKKEDLFAPKQIASVQSTWQPTMQNGGSPAKPQSYLMSDEKAQSDQQLAQRRAAEAQAAAQAQAQAQAARQSAQAQQQQQQAVPTIKNPEQAQNDTGWKQFYNEEFNKAKKSQNFVQRLMDGGQASRRAELNARNRYTSSLLNRAYDDNGNILDANAAQSAHALAQYNSGVAANNTARTRAISNAIGATHESQDQNVFDRLKSTANAVRNMNIYDGVVGVNDETKFSLDDIGRFGGSLVQGIATAPILAGKSLTEAVTGRGTKADTGLEGELTGAERAGRTISGLLDAVTPFMAGSGQLVQSLATKVMANAATAAERRLLNRMLTAAAEESILSGSQAGAEYFGQGGVLVDENGEIDVDKLAQFGKEVGMGAGMGAVGGAALSGAATGINRLGNRGNKLTPEPRPQPTDGNVTFQPASASGSREITLSRPLPITDTYVPPRQPTQPIGPTIPKRPLTPEPQQMTPEPQTPKTPEQTAIDEVRQREQAQREQPIEQTPVRDESAQPIPEVADGVVNPQPVLPDMPEVRSEQVRALQEARVGKSQAEEAVINQRLQQIESSTPQIKAETPRDTSNLAKKLRPGTYAQEKVTLYRGNNDTNRAQSSPDRAVYHADTPEYAETYGNDVSSKEVEGGVFTANGIHAYDELTKQLRKELGKRIDTEAYKKLTGNEKTELDSWLNHTLEGERLSRQFNRPMPEALKQAFDDVGIDYIRIPGDQFKGTVGKVGHQTEIIELPKPKQLQEARAGTTQAEEAVINQRLQELKPISIGNNTPEVDGNDVLVYHRTNRDAADAIRQSGYFDPEMAGTGNDRAITEDGRVTYFNNNDSQTFYGDEILQGRMPIGEYNKQIQDNLDTISKLEKEIANGEVPEMYVDGIRAQIENIKNNPELLSRNRIPLHQVTPTNGAPAIRGDADTPRIDAESQTPRKSAGDELADIDARLERGEIDFDEAGRLEDEIFARESKAGRMMAQEARAGKSQAQEAVINQQLQEAQASTPRIDSNLPDDMTPVGAEPATNGIDIEVLKRGISKIDAPKEVKGRIARAVGKELDTELPLSDILDDPKVSPWLKDKITTAYNKLEKLTAKENAIQARGIESVSKGVIPVKDVELTKTRNSLIAERGRAERNLLGYVKQLEGRVSKTARLANITENVVGSKNTNQLTSAALLERNATQELGGNIQALITNPVAFTKGLFGSGSALKSAGKSALMEWTVTPKVISDAPRYLIGNLYNTLMTPSTALARHRRGMNADASAEMVLRTAGMKNPTQAEIRAYSALQGAENEALVNTMVGVFNGMSSKTQANRASDAFAEFIKTGSEAAHKTFLQNLEKQTTLAKSLMDTTVQGLGKNAEGQSSLRHEAAVRIGSAYVNMFLPYLSNVTNLTKTAVSQTLNPLARSTVDQILKSVRSKPQNIWAIVKQKSGDYGMLAGVGMMISAGVIGYNDGEEVDKPRGVYIDLGDGNYMPIRATHVEVPVAAAVTAGMIAKDIASGDMRDAEYYAKIMTASLPYLDSIEQHAGAVNSLVKGSSEEGDNMYGAKAWAVNQGRSFVPLSNNAVQQWSARNRGESLNAKKVYDKDMGKWFANSVRQNYDPAFRDSLEDSRDMAGRVRTVDNQGSVVNKRINDQNTKTYNSTITDLVTYARQNKLGNGTQEMFNTYPDGKNNNFKSVQDKITFLDAPEKGGKKTPDNAKKLEPNEKLYDLSQQIYNGFFGDTGADLLTLDGANLMSDASVSGKSNPNNNSSLPISILSIRGAIAETDLPQEDWDKLNSISEAKSAIAERAKSGEIKWSAYYDALPEFSAQENAILANSPGNQKMSQLMTKLRDTGFFEPEGLGSTRSGQTYLWNSLNAMLGDKGKTPAAQWAESGSGSGFTPWGKGGGGRKGFNNIMTPAEMGTKGIRWSPVGKRQMASVKTKGYTPLKTTVKLNNAVKRDRTQNYADRSI